MNNKEYYILFCKKDETPTQPEVLFFILNTDPLLFTDDISKAKKYHNRIIAMNTKIKGIHELLAKKLVDSVYMGIMVDDKETGRIRII